ncbi:MAG: hypothetical protein DRN37_10885 [Thermoplasmata archaeon]|nr:MAG: hypothetical protein DRN37_10885 [Thermoplasmata archaeon]
MPVLYWNPVTYPLSLLEGEAAGAITTMERETHTSRKGGKEDIIFKAAVRTIKDKGFHRARMSDIAKEAGISYGLVYHYFRNKEDLFDSILNRWWDSLFLLLHDLEKRQTKVQDKLSRIIEYFLETYQKDPELVNVFITEVSRSTANLTRHRLEHFKKWMSMTEAIIKEGQESGVLRVDFKARYLTYIFLGALETFVSAMVLAGQEIKDDAQKQRISDSILEVFMNGARPGNSKNP